ncbi:hypothetical protein [Amnibacterium kyonggiense]|uniref:DUF4386 family protein n=1 Tax=Amnibacterium kyonggiense TaxID=595671 RepID=A0A4R7FT97_9MICO|nr:hypothetical protein [Amnibacterium kyonggiense]TDS81090.1 hypothetical protein CLV52_1665 [Amnibacterium kyonggiense]
MTAEHRWPAGWPTPNVGLWTGIAALGVAVLTITEFVIRQVAVGPRPALDEVAALVAFNERTAAGTLGVILTDTVLMAVIIVFLSGFRQLIVQTRRDVQWIADIGFSAGIAYVVVTLVGDGLEGGAALDASIDGGSGMVIRALTVGHALFFGSIGCVLTALVSFASGYITLISGALPRWTGWLAVLVAIPNLVFVATAFGGTDDTSFRAAGGWGSVVLGTFPWLVWIVSVGIVVIRERESHLARAEVAREPHTLPAA